MRVHRSALALALTAFLACAPAQAGPVDLVELMDGLVRQGDETPQDAIVSITEIASKDLAKSP